MEVSRKLFRVLLFFVIVITFNSCLKNNEEFVEAKLTAVFDLPANLNPIETHYVYIRNVKSLYNETLATRGLKTDDISKVLAHRCRLYGRFGGANLSIFSNISIRALSKDGNNTRSEMFYLDEIALNGRSELQLLSSVSELKPVMELGAFDIEIRMQIRGFVPASLPLQFDFSYLAVLK